MACFRHKKTLIPTEEIEEDLQSFLFWESFVKGLFEGTLDPEGKSGKSMDDIDAKTLAGMLNSKYLSQDPKDTGSLDFTLLSNHAQPGP